jgi:hypothetical protein
MLVEMHGARSLKWINGVSLKETTVFRKSALASVISRISGLT